MKLRLATNSDFSFYKKLFDTDECDMLYYRRSKVGVEEEASISSWNYYFDEETLAQIEEEMRLTKVKFVAQLREEYNRTFIVLNGERRIGFIYLSISNKNKPSIRKNSINIWKMHDFCLEEQYQGRAKEVLDLLMKEKFMDEISVCMIDEENIKTFLEAGYKSTGGGFYHRKSSS